MEYFVITEVTEYLALYRGSLCHTEVMEYLVSHKGHTIPRVRQKLQLVGVLSPVNC